MCHLNVSRTAACLQQFKADIITALGHKHSAVFDQLAFCTREDKFLRIWSEADTVIQRYNNLGVCGQSSGASREEKSNCFFGTPIHLQRERERERGKREIKRQKVGGRDIDTHRCTQTHNLRERERERDKLRDR